jgi:hypothetical protein
MEIVMSQSNQSDLFSSKVLKLKFKIGSFHSSNRLILEDDKITITPSPYAIEETAVTCIPSNENWLEFSHNLEQLNVLSWDKSYHDPSILDGTQWSLLVLTESYEVDTGGSNAYPGNFDELIKTINRLISQEYFTLNYNRTSRYISG